MSADILDRRTSHLVLWAPRQRAPAVVLGTFVPGAPPTLGGEQTVPLQAVPGLPGLFQVSPAACGMRDGTVYHYWFEVEDTAPGKRANARIRVADPVAMTTDWRLVAGDQPASVVKFESGALVACDPDGTGVAPAAPSNFLALPTNNRIVLYELPTAWARKPRGGGVERGVGTFRDIVALIEPGTEGANFDEFAAAHRGRAHILDLGVNAIELLPPADSSLDREWGYGTSHMFAPDWELGKPEHHTWPTANADLRRLVEVCHRRRIRVFVDIVMGFARNGPYQHIDFDDFHILVDRENPPDDEDAFTSRPPRNGRREPRQDFGSRLFRYVKRITTYDPVTGAAATISPARQLQLAALERWMRDFHVDGYRIDSVETVANWDFLGSFTARGRERFRERCALQGMTRQEADARYLVVGEELHEPIEIIRPQHRIDALWHDKFRDYIRNALSGRSAPGESFELTVRKAIDCRAFGYADLAEAVIYLGSHDVEGFHRERIATMFRYEFPIEDGMPRREIDARNAAIARRVKLGFACLLTAVGIPMILAGDEFADEHDLFNIRGNVSHEGGKQIDPVNFSRLEGDGNAWRRDVLEYVTRLVTLRTSHPALAVNDTKFLHADFTPGRRVLVWQRGPDGDPVIVVANFSDFQTEDPFNPSSEYVVPNWPRRQDVAWREVPQNRTVAPRFVGREPIFPWEAKVYARA